ncbi:outer membrane beta-barrel protein [Algibacter amylolyticus]|uniref:Outer membrane protein beta-barrel domain-containing protein n=2 Tax=Algibacter TaxID=261827 RepID=A0A1I1MUM9_9FLAO|nr:MULTISPECIES: outer membrane beta-barrel protein [Algibacter]KAA5827964.1 outer membrane beta-barrel protein [Algibacter amylolyticus]MBB5267200.1 OOP family OmpA-OmpF porin [Algibacter amylolyticus]TSJ82209.1 outer membrane beta-barrel protein [Algibacter amylolyticus]SFC85290.1 Outer membrane protein beta-barrel domain-containing protein [Algibacter pectinivorans]
MTSSFKLNTNFWLAIAFLIYSFSGFSQGDTSTFKAQFALGVNSPSSSGFVEDFESNSINFPTINLGLQYMFKQRLGVKLDLGYNRFANADNTPEFKVNYTRINAQAVYDASVITSFVDNLGAFVHAGPGFTMIKPLGDYGNNKTSYLNAMAGIELHYGVSDKLSIYVDASYVKGFSKDFSPVTSGFGSFNGDILTLTFGASISLSGCYYCGD